MAEREPSLADFVFRENRGKFLDAAQTKVDESVGRSTECLSRGKSGSWKVTLSSAPLNQEEIELLEIPDSLRPIELPIILELKGESLPIGDEEETSGSLLIFQLMIARIPTSGGKRLILLCGVNDDYTQVHMQIEECIDPKNDAWVPAEFDRWKSMPFSRVGQIMKRFLGETSQPDGGTPSLTGSFAPPSTFNFPSN